MKQNIGKLSEADLKARRRFWNKKGFFGEPTKRAIERSSMKMQKLVKALKTFSFEEVKRIRATKYPGKYPGIYLGKYPGKYFTEDMHTVRNASESDLNHAISTFKIF